MATDEVGTPRRLYLADGIPYGVREGALVQIAATWETLTETEKAALFDSAGSEAANPNDLAALGKCSILSYGGTNAPQGLTLSVIPQDKLILPREFARIDGFSGIDQGWVLNRSVGINLCKVMVTHDMENYWTYDFDAKEWNIINLYDSAAVRAQGIDVLRFAEIDRAGWDALLKGKSGVGFAYLIGIDSASDQCALDKLVLQADKKGVQARGLATKRDIIRYAMTL